MGAGEEFAESSLFREVKTVGDRSDAEVRRSEEERCFHQEKPVYIVNDLTPVHLSDNPGQVGRRDIELPSIKKNVVVALSSL